MSADLSDELVHAVRSREIAALAGRERVAAIVGGSGFAVIAIAMALFVPSDRSPSPLLVILFVAAFAVLSLIEFEVGPGRAVPTQLMLVPMLFVLPVGTVPLAAGVGYLIAHGANLARRRVALDRALVLLGCSWYAIGPATVLALAGEPAARLDAWPLLVAAFAAQIALDLATTCLNEWWVFGTSPRLVAPFAGWVYAVDAVLAPIAACVAIATVEEPVAALVVLPLGGLLALFASERRRRIDQAVELSTAYRGTALLLGDVVEADDAYTGSHSKAVVDLVLAVCDELGVGERERRRAEFTALLHDVGKIAIPKEIINKPGPLDAEERRTIETHTIEGEAILVRVGGVLGEVGALVRSCHERWDGEGYPDGHAGEAIPLVARIVCACDAYSAITTDRAYRAARSPAEALTELVRCAGTQFDPRVVDALCLVVGRDEGAAPALPLAS